jgi:hypothetical protein
MTEHVNAALGLRGWLIGLTVLGILATMGSAIPLMMSPMIFDSGESAWAWTLFLAMWLSPVAWIGGIIVGWIGYSFGSHFLTLAGVVLIALPFAALVGAIILGFAGII